jgi:hypothetical protein
VSVLARALFVFAVLVIGSCSRVQVQSDFEQWLKQDPARASSFARFEALLDREGVGEVVAVDQLWRTDRLAPACVKAPYSIPPEELWPHIVPALRFIRDHVKPSIGDVEVVSAYRDPAFNECIRGAPQSAHQSFHALDMTPASAGVTRAALIEALRHAPVGST